MSRKVVHTPPAGAIGSTPRSIASGIARVVPSIASAWGTA